MLPGVSEAGYTGFRLHGDVDRGCFRLEKWSDISLRPLPLTVKRET